MCIKGNFVVVFLFIFKSILYCVMMFVELFLVIVSVDFLSLFVNVIFMKVLLSILIKFYIGMIGFVMKMRSSC